MDELRLAESRVDAYLDRIGAVRPAVPDGESLRELHQRHLRSVPFENLSIHLGEEITLEPTALVDKLVRARRGGFCYELNGAFAALLASLGYPVTLLSGRVFGEGGLGPPFDHLAVRIDTPERWLVDVGFGRHTEFPLRLDDRGDQHDPGGVFRIVETSDGDLDVYRNNEPQYRLEPRPRTLSDFELACWWQRTSPKSHFTRSLVCSLPTPGGRISLNGRTLVTTDGDGRHETKLASDADVLAAYQRHFGITLDRVPVVRSGTRGDGGRHGDTNDPTIDDLISRQRGFAAARDWQRHHTPKNLATALIVEAAEVNEIFQWLTPEESTRVMDDPVAAANVRDEIADVFAYLLQLADTCGVNPARALADKMDRNELRFPVPGQGA